MKAAPPTFCSEKKPEQLTCEASGWLTFCTASDRCAALTPAPKSRTRHNLADFASIANSLEHALRGMRGLHQAKVTIPEVRVKKLDEDALHFCYLVLHLVFSIICREPHRAPARLDCAKTAFAPWRHAARPTK